MLQPVHWPEIASQLADAIGQREYSTWFSSSSLVHSDAESVTIGLPNAFVLAAAQSRHGPDLERAVAAAAGRVLRINYQTISGRQISDDSAAAPEPAGRASAPTLQPPYSMDGFVVGPENQLAFAAAQAIAAGNNGFSPLFLHGPCGVGKTHLLRAIAAAAGRDRRPLYSTLEQFTNQLVSALRNNASESLRNRYRSADIALFDDVYFVSGKRATQEELFHTFDTIAANGGAVVLASDRSPTEMDDLPNRLRSRFASGIVVDIQPPGFEMRLAFIDHLARRAQIQIEPAVRAVLASSNIVDFRKLTGVFNRLIAEHHLRAEPITSAQARALLASHDHRAASGPPDPDELIAAVARLCRIEVKLITGTSRRRTVVEARNLCAYALREFTGRPLAAIGECLGGRTHSTILHAIRRADSRLARDPATQRIYEQLERQFGTG